MNRIQIEIEILPINMTMDVYEIVDYIHCHLEKVSIGVFEIRRFGYGKLDR